MGSRGQKPYAASLCKGNKISWYTGSTQFELEVRQLEKAGVSLYALFIQPVSIPIVFREPGTYDVGAGKLKAAFSIGTVYFRHGGKSEPGTRDGDYPASTLL